MRNNTIDYIEFNTTDLVKVKVFYSEVFWWEFKDFWDTYTAFSSSGVKWWFELSDSVQKWGVLVSTTCEYF